MKTTTRKWTEEENQVIREKYLELSDSEIAEILERTERGVHSQRLSLGLYRPKKKIAYRKTSNVCYYDYEQIKNDFHNRGYILLSEKSECGKSSSLMRYICKKHEDQGELIITEHHFYEGKGCPYCGREKTSKSRESKWNSEDDKSLCESKGFEYIKTEKIDGRHQIFFICPKHRDIGVQSMRRGNMNRESVHGCQYCIGRNIPEWYYKKHIYDEYGFELLSDFKGMSNKQVTCRCILHDNIFTYYSDEVYYYGRGCKQCSSERLGNAKRLSNEEVLDRIYSHGNNIKIMNIEDYTSTESKLKVHCNTCGYEWESPVHSMFISGAACPHCTHASYGERKIALVLDDLKINHKMQYIIDDCKCKRPLPFDDSVLDNDGNLIGLIEYMGIQHYSPIEFFGGEDSLEERALHDKIKKDYCKKHDIPLLIIPYWEYDNINTLIKDFINKLDI